MCAVELEPTSKIAALGVRTGGVRGREQHRSPAASGGRLASKVADLGVINAAGWLYPSTLLWSPPPNTVFPKE